MFYHTINVELLFLYISCRLILKNMFYISMLPRELGRLLKGWYVKRLEHLRGWVVKRYIESFIYFM